MGSTEHIRVHRCSAVSGTGDAICSMAQLALLIEFRRKHVAAYETCILEVSPSLRTAALNFVNSRAG